MSEKPISPLRRRSWRIWLSVELGEKTKSNYIHHD